MGCAIIDELHLPEGLKVAVTGHRPDKLACHGNTTKNVAVVIDRSLDMLFNRYGKLSCLFTGMALGVDQIACEVALAKQIHVVACIPCLGQHIKWPKHCQEEYKNLIERITQANGDFIMVSEEPYTPYCMFVRDEFMVDNSDLLLACYNGDKIGGTAHTVKCAQKRNKPIVNIWDDLFKDEG